LVLWKDQKQNDKPPSRIIKKIREKTQITKIRNDNKDIKINFREIKRMVRKYYEKLYALYVNTLYEISNFLNTQNIKLTQGKI
jgi:hypothetical protein